MRVSTDEINSYQIKGVVSLLPQIDNTTKPWATICPLPMINFN
jgi:hypothetical protein